MYKDYGLIKELVYVHYVLVMVFKMLKEPQYGYVNLLMFVNLYYGY